MERKKKLRLTDFQCRLLTNALICFRTQVTEDGKPTRDINELVLKIIKDSKLERR